MASTETSVEETSPPKARGSSKRSLFLAVALCLIGMGFGYFGVSSGLVSLPISSKPAVPVHASDSELPDVAFVPIPTLIVTLPPDAKNDHLRFSGEIEVRAEFQEEIEFVMPRIQNFLNGYLRSLTANDIEGQGSLFRIRIQVFRRIAGIVGLGKVNNLLVTEFILN